MLDSRGAVRVFIASSLDGFIAGPDGDLSWLPQPGAGEDYGYHGFMARIGVLVMGRASHDAVAGFVTSGEVQAWPYADLPVLVATHRPLTPLHPRVRAVDGPIVQIIEEARAEADGRDVYLDGGDLIRQALHADLIDELIVTMIPIVLGSGAPLFAGARERREFELLGSHSYAGGVVQLRYAPVRRASSWS